MTYVQWSSMSRAGCLSIRQRLKPDNGFPLYQEYILGTRDRWTDNLAWFALSVYRSGALDGCYYAKRVCEDYKEFMT